MTKTQVGSVPCQAATPRLCGKLHTLHLLVCTRMPWGWGGPRGGLFTAGLQPLSRKMGQKIQMKPAESRRNPSEKKQNYRPAPCSSVFPTDRSPSSRGVRAGNADSAQSSRPGGGGLYTAVTSPRPAHATGQSGGAEHHGINIFIQLIPPAAA